jgi:hypothetical protein
MPSRPRRPALTGTFAHLHGHDISLARAPCPSISVSATKFLTSGSGRLWPMPWRPTRRRGLLPPAHPAEVGPFFSAVNPSRGCTGGSSYAVWVSPRAATAPHTRAAGGQRSLQCAGRSIPRSCGRLVARLTGGTTSPTRAVVPATWQ